MVAIHDGMKAAQSVRGVRTRMAVPNSELNLDKVTYVPPRPKGDSVKLYYGLGADS